MDSGRGPAAYLVGVILIAVGARIALTASLVPQHRFSVGFSSCATRALEPVALAAVAWVLAGMFPAPAPGFHSPANPNRMARRWLFVFCMVIFGIKHFLYAAIIATSIPLWISGHRFWVYFTGIIHRGRSRDPREDRQPFCRIYLGSDVPALGRGLACAQSCGLVAQRRSVEQLICGAGLGWRNVDMEAAAMCSR